MKFYLTAFFALGLSSALFAQENNPAPPPPPTPPVAGVPEILPDQDQIIINKSGKDLRITVEIKDGKVFINGKPAEEYKGDDVILRKSGEGHDYFYFNGLDQNFTHVSPFAWSAPHAGGSYSRDGNQPFLGVGSVLNEGGGARITNISPGSGAEKAGLKKDDIIKKINDIDINEPSDLTDAVHKFKPNEKITLSYTRDGKEQKADAILGRHKVNLSYSYSMPNLDIQPGIKNFNFDFPAYMYKTQHRLGIKAQDTEDDKGAKVLDVDEDSPAGKAGIQEGDIITQFDGKPVTNASALAELARSNKDKSSYKIKLARKGTSMEVEVKIPKDLKTADL
jgi:serine protease Do